MVLRKPYAFLIKHFKIIHFILSLLFLYIFIKTVGIAHFFANYVNANYTTNEVNIAASYISIFIYIFIVLIILISLMIYLLMKQKEKSTRLYFGILIFYLLLFLLTTFTYNAMITIEDTTFSAQGARMYRDIAYISYVPQIFFLVYSFLRGIGFDVKKFNFEDDLREFEVTDVDNEEFELNIGKNRYKYQRGFRRFFREFKYYFLEYKFAFFVLLISLVIGVGTIVYLNFGVYHRSYGQSQRMNHNGLAIQVVDSELTNMDLSGKVFDNGKYYMAVSLNITNNNSKKARLDYENFKLLVNNNMLMPVLDRGSYFADLGIPYTRNMEIDSQSSGVYVLVYELDKSMINQAMNIRILEALENTLMGVTPVYKDIRLDYNIVDEKKDVASYNLGKTMEFSDSRLGITQLQVKSFLITNAYTYNYENCVNDKCQKLQSVLTVDPLSYGADKTILVIDASLSLDTKSYYYQTRRGINSFFQDFVWIRYSNNSDVKEVPVQNITPNNLKDVLALAVSNQISLAEHLDLLVQIRGQVYVMKLK